MSATGVQELERIKGLWFGGGPAATTAPPEWKSALGIGGNNGGAIEHELRLLARVGHALQVAMTPGNAPSLSFRHPLPRLPHPFLPERLRPAFRRLLAMYKDNHRHGLILTLIGARGYVEAPTITGCSSIHASNSQ